MVRFGGTDIEEAMKLGREAAELISQKFEAPIKLQFEYLYCPYLLINRKRYAGVYYTNPLKYDKIDSKVFFFFCSWIGDLITVFKKI